MKIPAKFAMTMALRGASFHGVSPESRHPGADLPARS
jgi:hypothetical protein